ncbi:hypothetical protein D4764_22G0007270 [Takifugu flavidus]|uniref:Uncharacterized protein n=1 Tax=Takifugu flavidus TaxID=433684 RepID=A0A5C6NGE8_9TELE|nr:hypothetical protein D4764_22G0007270 [Takifugu flavidus]
MAATILLDLQAAEAQLRTGAKSRSWPSPCGSAAQAAGLLQQEHQNLQRHKECVKTGRILLLLLQISYGDLLNRVGAAAGIHPQLRT